MDKFLKSYGGYYLRKSLYDFCKSDYIDGSALRFLRARKWDVDRAVAMLCAALGFRLDMDLEGLLAKGENGLKDVPGFLNQFRRGISYVRGNTGNPGEHPIYFIHVARHFTSAQKIETLQQFVLIAMESTRQLCSPPMEKAVIVFDLTGFGLKNMDWQCVLFLVRCLEAYYPESLHRIYVHGAPWIFRGIWSVLAPMLDPVVRNKIKFTTKAKDLEEYIPAYKLRVGMGGTMEWDWDYTEPDPHENDLLQRTNIADRIREERDELWAEFEQITLEWCQANSDEAIPDLTFRRIVLQKQIRLKQLQLSPYIRATNVYQRQGILNEANSHAWDYPQKDGSTRSQAVGDRHSIPALFQWLLDHNQDVFLDSYGTRYGACGTDRPPELIPSWVKKFGPVSVPALALIPRSPVQTHRLSGAGHPSYAAVASHHVPLARTPPGVSHSTSVYPNVNGSYSGARSIGDAESSDGARTAGAGGGVYDSAVSGRSSSADWSSLSHGADGFATPPEYGEQEEMYNASAHETTGNPTVPLQRSAFDNGLNDSAFDESVRTESTTAPMDSSSAQGQEHAYPDDSKYGHNTEQSFGVDDAEDDDDDTAAPETYIRPDYIPHKPPKSSQVYITDQQCRQGLAIVRKVVDLFLDSRMLEAEELCIVDAGTHLYKAAGMGLINFVKSFMTFEPNDIQTAIHCCKHTLSIASLLRKKHGVGKLINRKSFFRSMTLVQLHAELCYAENLLLINVLRIIKAGGGIGLVRHALGLRSAYLILQDMYRFMEATDASAERDALTGKSKPRVELDQDFRSGLYFAYASCSLVLSFMPGRVHKVLEGLGYLGDRSAALSMLQSAGGWSKSRSYPTISAEEEGCRRALCDILIIVYHVVLPTFVPVLVDIAFADQVLQWNLARFPHGIFFLYFQARLYAAQALPEKSIEYLRNSIEAQHSFSQLDHISFFDLALTYLSTCDFARAYECFDVLSRESNWSRAIYQYARAVCLVERGMDDQAKSATIMRTVAGLRRKLAGVNIPLEDFVTTRAKQFVAQHNRLPLPGLEFSYLWHCMGQTPVFLLVENTLTRIDDFIDDLERYVDLSAYGSGENEYWQAYCLSFFLRGVALRYVAFPDERTIVRAPPAEAIGSQGEVVQDAVLSFQKVIQQGHRLDRSNNWLIYFAHYELGRLLECTGNRRAAMYEFELVLSGRSLEQHGRGYGTPGGPEYMSTRKPMSSHAQYLLSNMCMLRTRAAVDTMRIRQERPPAALYKAAPVNRQSFTSLGSRSAGATSASAQSSFFAAAAPGTTLSDVVGYGSVRAPSSRARTVSDDGVSNGASAAAPAATESRSYEPHA